ncbi:MAG: AmmeMemoRadiSam system protein B [bacterium]
MAISGCEDKEDEPKTRKSAQAVQKSEKSRVPEKAGKREVQEPVVAGRFYPASRSALANMIETFLEKAEVPELSGAPLGYMVPHAGYPYSGPVAAHVYKSIKRTGAKKFVIMGPAHRVRFDGVYVMDKDAYKTPLGEVDLMREEASELVSARPWIRSGRRLYGREHSVEVQLPFLQKVAGPDLSVLVMVIGQTDHDKVDELARLLHETFQDEDVTYLASTDMSHGNIPPYQGSKEIEPVDRHTLELIKNMDREELEKGLRDKSAPLCGGLPVLTLMKLFELEGGDKVKVLAYGDSGDATGDHSRVVGYGAVAFLGPAGDSQGARVESVGGYTLTKQDKGKLMEIARKTVEAAVKGEDIPSFEVESENLKRKGAAFVTLKTDGRLRGCIGSIIATRPLYKCVRKRAVDASLHDARFAFNRLKPEELSALEVEVSVLTPPRPVSDPKEVEVGKDGVILSKGRRRGVFLPQVPVEQGWDRQAYLSNLCRKAGIRNRDCYKDPQARIETFRAIVFSEHEFKEK